MSDSKLNLSSRESAASSVGSNVELLSSSAGLNWTGILVERKRVPPFEVRDLLSPYHSFSLLTCGSPSLEFTCDEHKYEAVPEAMHIMPANLTVSLRSSEPKEFVKVSLEESRLKDLIGGLDQTIHFRPEASSNDLQLKALIEALIAEAEAGGPNGVLFVDSLVTALAVHYVSAYAENTSSGGEHKRKLTGKQFRSILKYMDEHLGSNLTLDDLAATIDMSKYHFSRMFKEDTGVTPYRYFLSRRLEKGRSLLDKGCISITEIAHQLNFSDQSHFSRNFRKHFGISPKSYLQQKA